MAAFPSYVKLGWTDSGESHAPIVERSDMERGVPKQRRTQADVLVTVPLPLFFDSSAAATNFENWFYSDGMGWFDFTHPRTGAVVQARIVGGDIGQLVPLKGDWSRSQRTVKLEYVRVSL
jgi:hypothetical protein